MKTLTVQVRVQVTGWVDVRREVPDDFDPNNIDVSRTAEDVLVAQMAADAEDRVADIMAGIPKVKTLEVRAEVTP